MLGYLQDGRDHAGRAVARHAGSVGEDCHELCQQIRQRILCVDHAEVRARLVHMSCVRRDSAAAKAKVVAAGGTHPYDAASPWEWVFRETANDTKCWRAELEEPALLVKAQVARVSVDVEGDAPLNKRQARLTGVPKEQQQ